MLWHVPMKVSRARCSPYSLSSNFSQFRCKYSLGCQAQSISTATMGLRVGMTRTPKSVLPTLKHSDGRRRESTSHPPMKAHRDRMYSPLLSVRSEHYFCCARASTNVSCTKMARNTKCKERTAHCGKLRWATLLFETPACERKVNDTPFIPRSTLPSVELYRCATHFSMHTHTRDNLYVSLEQRW